MKVILSATETIEYLCGYQKSIPDLTWRITAHCILVPCDDGVLLYHTMTGCLVLLNEAEADTIDSDVYLRSELAKYWFLVPKEFNERKYSRQIREILQAVSGKKKNVTHFTVLPTTACNARCAYCFEQGVHIRTMSDTMAHDVAEYIAKACGGEEVSFSWFGGEPLCNIPAIRIICEKLRNKGIAFKSIMTSNGFYFTPEISKEAKIDWKVDNIQITLDGTKHVYERIKGYVGIKEGAFDRVLNNIEGALINGINVIIRLNVDKNNAENLLTLIDELGERFGEYDNCSIAVSPLRSLASSIAEFDDLKMKERALKMLSSKVKKLGFNEAREMSRSFKLNQCKADNDSCLVILPDGNLAKCNHYLDGPYIGNIYSTEHNEKVIADWKAEQPEFPECANCPLYPNCIRLNNCAWLRNGCDEMSRYNKIENVRRGVLKLYEKWLNSSESDNL